MHLITWVGRPMDGNLIDYLRIGGEVLLHRGPQLVHKPVILAVERVQVTDGVLNCCGRTSNSLDTSVPAWLKFFQFASVALEADIIDLIGARGGYCDRKGFELFGFCFDWLDETRERVTERKR